MISVASDAESSVANDPQRPRVTKLCERSPVLATEDEEKNPSPPTLPPIQSPAFPNLINDVTDSVASISSVTIPCSKSGTESVQPPIVRPTGYVGFGVIPELQRLEGMKSRDRGHCRQIILDLRAVTKMETCVAEYVKKLASMLNPLSPAQSFIFLLPGPDSSTVVADLQRGGITLSDDSRSLTMERCADEDAALRLCRFREWSHLSKVQDLLDKETVFLNQRAQMFLRHSPHLRRRTCNDIAQRRCIIRRVSLKKAATCAQYPHAPTFVVLDGTLVLEKRHSTAASLPRMALRTAIAATASMVWMSLTHGRGRSRPNSNTLRASHYLHPGDTFTQDTYPDSCAYAVGGPCFILDVTLASEAMMDSAKEKPEFWF